MSVTLRGERAEGRQRTASADEITYQRVFVVQSSADNIGARAVSFCSGLPFLGHAYATDVENDPLVRCISRSASPIDKHRRLWEVTCNYSSKHDDQDPDEENGEEEQLEFEPPEVSLTFTRKTRAITGAATVTDSYGAVGINAFGGVTTSAGEPFDPPAEEEIFLPVLTIARNEINANFALWNDYTNSVNSVAFLGAEPRTVRLAVEARKQYKKNLRYYRVQYVCEFDDLTWDLQLLDIGTWYLEAGDAGAINRKYFLTEDDPPQPRLGLLNGFGAPLDDGADPVFRRFKRRKERDLNALQLQAAINA